MTDSAAIDEDKPKKETVPAGIFRIWRHALATLALIVAPLLFFWGLGLFSFAALMTHNEPEQVNERTDAIVVLTGGTGRLEAGLDLLAGDMAGQMLISGVYAGVELPELLEMWHGDTDGRDLSCCITLDYTADDTQGNAKETAKWLRESGYTSIRLVTANYHMPRASMLFRTHMPDIRIIKHPVRPSGIDLERWWSEAPGRRLVINEYNKYLLTGFGTALSALPGGMPEQDTLEKGGPQKDDTAP